MPTEVEARFRADGRDRVAWLSSVTALGNVELGPARTFEEVDRYLDTDARALAEAGWACRLRTRGNLVTISLKGPAVVAPSGRGIHRRPEVEGPATPSEDPRTWPPSDARERVDRLRAGAPLREVLALRQVRTERTVSRRGAPFATLSIDEVTVDRAGLIRGPFHVVEVELDDVTPDGEEGLADLAVALAERGLAPDRLTKLERAIELLAGR
jgi:inorganic triphosphatase YgiF